MLMFGKDGIIRTLAWRPAAVAAMASVSALLYPYLGQTSRMAFKQMQPVFAAKAVFAAMAVFAVMAVFDPLLNISEQSYTFYAYNLRRIPELKWEKPAHFSFLVPSLELSSHSVA
ncbi:hypothetical protein Tco_1086435 [Tanacetum coccineum]